VPQIGIISGLKSEEAALASVMGHGNAPYVRLSGARPARAHDGVQALIALGVDGILSFGSAGAASPDMKPGDLLVASGVRDPAGIVHATDKAWTEVLSTALGVSPVMMAGIDQVAGAATKSGLHVQHGVAGVDMESHIAASQARAAGIPFCVLRAIVDPVDFEMPAYVLDTVRPDGSVSILPVLAGLCLQPWTIGRLADLNRFNRSAMDALSSAARTLGPGFGFLTLKSD
jgi:adenosylhomocysteine nucleosidase